METFEMNVPRTLNAFVEGNFLPWQALYEMFDNLFVAKATQGVVTLVPETGSGASAKRSVSQIVIADNGIGMTADELIAGLIFGGDNNHNPDDISDFGVGLKAACFALGKTFAIITRGSDGDLNYARVNWDELKETGQYVGPRNDIVPDNLIDLWNTHALDTAPEATGTIIIIDDITTSYFKNCATFETGIVSRLGVRYAKPINSGSLTISTVIGAGAPSPVPSVDYLELTNPETEVVLDQFQVYTDKATGEETTYELTLTRVPKGSSAAAGMYVEVADIVVYLDGNRWLGVYQDRASHSWRWNLRGKISFRTKGEFRKVLGFASHKHRISYRSESFGDYLRDTELGSAIADEERERKAEAKLEKLADRRRDIASEDAAFAGALNDNALLYGSSTLLVGYRSNIVGFRVGKFTLPTEMSRLAGGVIEYNNRNPKLSELLHAKKSTIESRKIGRAIAAANALVEDVTSNGKTIAALEYQSFVANLVTML
jgi:hypothetical protein